MTDTDDKNDDVEPGEDELQNALAAELRAAQAIAKIPIAEWVRNVPISRDSIYRVLRGKRSVSTVELILLCRVIQEDPLDLITRAMKRAGGRP